MLAAVIEKCLLYISIKIAVIPSLKTDPGDASVSIVLSPANEFTPHDK